MIHKTAVIHPNAELDPSVVVGPYAVIDEGVKLASGCVVGPHVYITGQTTIGMNNTFHAGAVIGDAPQDLKYKNEPTGLRIGDGNVFREHVTIHRSSKTTDETLIGSNNFFMANSHVAHNCVIGSNNIFANGALLGGHVSIADRVFISGNCLVHQFVRIGTLALMQGGSAISKDLPPFTIARGDNGICGLNIIGLRRAGLSSADRLELKKAYHTLFRSGKGFKVALAEAKSLYVGKNALLLLDFVAASKRGICRDTGTDSDTDSGE